MFIKLTDNSWGKVLDQSRTKYYPDYYLVVMFKERDAHYLDLDLIRVWPSTPLSLKFQECFPWFKTLSTSQYLQRPPLFFIKLHSEKISELSETDYTNCIQFKFY